MFNPISFVFDLFTRKTVYKLYPCVGIRSSIRKIKRKKLFENTQPNIKKLQNLHRIVLHYEDPKKGKERINKLNPKVKKKLEKKIEEFKTLNNTQLERLDSFIEELESILINNLKIIKKEKESINKFEKEIKNKIEERKAKRIIEELRNEIDNILDALLRQARQLKEGTLSTETLKEWSLQSPVVKLKRIKNRTIRIGTLGKAIRKGINKSGINEIRKFHRLKLRNAHIIGHKAGQLLHEAHDVVKNTPNNKETLKKLHDTSERLIEQTRRTVGDVKIK